MKTKLKFNFISSATLDEQPRSKRVHYILNIIKDGAVFVTDGVLRPEEEMNLIKETMSRIDDGFPGIEIASLRKPAKGMGSVLEKMTDQKERFQSLVAGIAGKTHEKSSLRRGITLIGPAEFIRKVKKHPDSFSILAEVYHES